MLDGAVEQTQLSGKHTGYRVNLPSAHPGGQEGRKDKHKLQEIPEREKSWLLLNIKVKMYKQLLEQESWFYPK